MTSDCLARSSTAGLFHLDIFSQGTNVRLQSQTLERFTIGVFIAVPSADCADISQLASKCLGLFLYSFHRLGWLQAAATASPLTYILPWYSTKILRTILQPQLPAFEFTGQNICLNGIKKSPTHKSSIEFRWFEWDLRAGLAFGLRIEI